MTAQNLFRAAAIACLLVSNGCAVGGNGADTIAEDGAVNHPIAVEPSFRDLKVQFAGGTEGMTTDDAVKFDAFLADYRVHGNGSLGISVPGGAASRAAITFFANRRRHRHQPRQDPGSTHDVANNDYRWSQPSPTPPMPTPGDDWSETWPSPPTIRRPPWLFGAAQYRRHGGRSPRPAGPASLPISGTRARAAVMDHYEKGEVTQANKQRGQRRRTVGLLRAVGQ